MEPHELTEYLRADLYRYGGATARWYFLKALSPMLPAFRYTYLLRHSAAYPRRSLRGILFRVLLAHFGHKYGYQITPGTKIGKGLYIGHQGPVVINGRAVIGENCTLPNVVTIGQTNRGKKAGCPTIGNNVFIGTGTVLVGKIVIGDHVLIAPNSYVTNDVPSRSKVVGNPAQCFPSPEEGDDPTEGYVNFVLAASAGRGGSGP